MATILHDSDCAIHNAPALPIGPCDCGAAEIERQPAKIESDAKVIAALREALTGIAEYCSTDGESPLGAIERLIAVRNTAERALRTHV